MSDTIWLALIVAVPTLFAGTVVPILVLRSNNKHALKLEDQKASIRLAEKTQDWARLDAVAAAAGAAAKNAETAAVNASNAARGAALTATETARLLEINTKAVAETAAETHSQLKVIHTLVNSTLTAAIKAQYEATIRELAMMVEVIDLKRKSGHEPSEDALAAVKATEATIAELRTVLADRLAQTNAAAAL